MTDILILEGVEKTYDSGFTALHGVDLTLREGEILALLGPNGAGKTTLISCICGTVMPTGGRITVGGFDALTDYRRARSLIGLVPQEIHLEPFSRVMDTVRYSRGLFGKGRNDAYIEKILRDLSLWDKRDSRVMELSGGMKRRVLIAKALSHEPRILFLDEPTAGVDVDLRKEMWEVVANLKAAGVSIVLTTHYIEEAEAMADRIGVINRGRLALIEEKAALMSRLGRKTLKIELESPVAAIPDALASYGLQVADGGNALVYEYEAGASRTGITRLLSDLRDAGLCLSDLSTRQSTLEEIFVGLVHQQEENA
ncbi:ABC transporter ATP-binding protein [Donghicola sp. C2-DW-16]|uniref:ABC transporter ATP-binding protein n=1 Tax=Donghicola mangrovi TaxID=2729614 RepID=A0ABX2PBN4_9RHOB|nr:ABC transporter ATP-binding protein [Donghicola mangrovi]NVO26521.1 ABC transporter ATP-binding protein [Donghicola mangrovi]